MPDEPGDREELERLRKLFESVEDDELDDSAMSELEQKLEAVEGDEEIPPDKLDELELKLRDVEDRFARDQESRRSAEESMGSEFDDRMARLHDKVDKVKQDRTVKAAERDRQMRSEASSARGAGLGLTVAYMIIGVPMFGAGIGWLIDRQGGTTHWIGLCTFFGAVLGVTIAVLTLQRHNSDK